MSLPAPRNPLGPGGLVPFEPRVDDAEARVDHLLALLKRSKWLILGCAAVSFAAGTYYARKAVPIYSASVSLRIEQNQSNQPDVWRAFSPSAGISTEMEVLGSRTLVEEATRILGLQVRLTEPQNVERDRLLTEIQVAADAKSAKYRLTRQANGTFEVSEEGKGRLSEIRPGERLSLGGATLRLTPEAASYPELQLRVSAFADAVARTALSVARAGSERDLADIIKLYYQDTDQGLAWKVPNVIAQSFIQRRQEAQKAQTRSQAKFLREQLDTISLQLSAAESDLKVFRERARVVDPTVEASSQINRLVNLQAERSSVEAERSSLASLLKQVEQRQQQQAAGKPSAYRDLLAFPTLLRSEAASRLLSSLAQVEDQRATLLTRRTEADPDVQLLTARIHELESQLSTMAVAYLQGLTDQVASLDVEIAGFGSELRKMPRKELEFARLERKPQVLKEMHTLLQTRLKEAEIAEAAVNSNVSIVDPAIRPRGPSQSKTLLFMLTSLVGGVLLGLGISIAREYTDRSIKTRSDATAASGLPVMAIVPRIRRIHRSAIIAKWSTTSAKLRSGNKERASPPAHRSMEPGYTFLPASATQESTPAPTPVGTEPTALVERHAPARMILSRSAGAVAEAYAILQTNVAFSRPDAHIKVLALTSSLPGEGKTTTAVNLALTLCQRGLSVCVIDADLRRPQLHQIFHIPREPGLSDVLRGLQTFEGSYRSIHIGETSQLAVLTAGSRGGSAPALVGSPRMRTLLGELRERFDLVILDTPPVNILTDAALLGVNADGVLIVVRTGSTDGAALGYAMEQLNHVRAPALGIVLNDVDLKRFGVYDDAYQYYAYSGAYTDSNVTES